MAELNRDLPSYWMHLDYGEQGFSERWPARLIARGAEQVAVGRWVYLSSGTGWVQVVDATPDRNGMIRISDERRYDRRVYLSQIVDAAQSHARLEEVRRGRAGEGAR
jgi:hypothetical protein